MCTGESHHGTPGRKAFYGAVQSSTAAQGKPKGATGMCPDGGSEQAIESRNGKHYAFLVHQGGICTSKLRGLADAC